jgi:hypothetical protein
MIRRNDGGDWLIIDQIEHARLAGEIAAAWGGTSVARPTVAAGLIWGVTHHDDGWADWDAQPRLDPANGLPRGFREMRMSDSTAIWSNSIAACSVEPLAGIGVSRHFCFLAEQAKRTRIDPDDVQSAERFVAEQAWVQQRLAASLNPASNNASREEACRIAFRTVQFFDQLSLWICCAEESEPHRQTTADRIDIAFIPATPKRIRVEPFPLRSGPLRVEATARRVTARAYSNDDDFRSALAAAPNEQLEWTFVAA